MPYTLPNPCLGCSYLEEVLGHPAMASLGRMRRRMAATSMLQLITGRASPVLLELKLFSQVMAVAMRTLREAPQFEVGWLMSWSCLCELQIVSCSHSKGQDMLQLISSRFSSNLKSVVCCVQEDRQDVQKAVDEMQHPTEGQVQAVMLRRMQLAQADPLFVYDLASSVRGALQLACQRHSQQELLEVSSSKAARKAARMHFCASPAVDLAAFPCSTTALHGEALCSLRAGSAGKAS